jgi:hypothetical protein
MKNLKNWIHGVTIALWSVAILLAWYQIIPWWLAIPIIIGAFVFAGGIASLAIRVILGKKRFWEIIAQAQIDAKNYPGWDNYKPIKNL